MEVANFLVTTAVAVIGLYLTNSLRRQQRLRVAEKRLEAYRELWALMIVARPTRLTKFDGDCPLTREEAKSLYQQTTQWYFGKGNGMLLLEPTKTLYLNVKDSLGAYSIGTGDEWRDEGVRVMHRLSLLRQQMKFDVDIWGVSYFETTLDEDDHKFLRDAGIDPARFGGTPPRLRR